MIFTRQEVDNLMTNLRNGTRLNLKRSIKIEEFAIMNLNGREVLVKRQGEGHVYVMTKEMMKEAVTYVHELLFHVAGSRVLQYLSNRVMPVSLAFIKECLSECSLCSQTIRIEHPLIRIPLRQVVPFGFGLIREYIPILRTGIPCGPIIVHHHVSASFDRYLIILIEGLLDVHVSKLGDGENFSGAIKKLLCLRNLQPNRVAFFKCSIDPETVRFVEECTGKDPIVENGRVDVSVHFEGIIFDHYGLGDVIEPVLESVVNLINSSEMMEKCPKLFRFEDLNLNLNSNSLDELLINRSAFIVKLLRQEGTSRAIKLSEEISTAESRGEVADVTQSTPRLVALSKSDSAETETKYPERALKPSEKIISDAESSEEIFMDVESTGSIISNVEPVRESEGVAEGYADEEEDDSYGEEEYTRPYSRYVDLEAASSGRRRSWVEVNSIELESSDLEDVRLGEGGEVTDVNPEESLSRPVSAPRRGLTGGINYVQMRSFNCMNAEMVHITGKGEMAISISTFGDEIQMRSPSEVESLASAVWTLNILEPADLD